MFKKYFFVCYKLYLLHQLQVDAEIGWIILVEEQLKFSVKQRLGRTHNSPYFITTSINLYSMNEYIVVMVISLL